MGGLGFVAGRPDARDPKTVASRAPHGGCRRFRVLEFDSVRFFVLSALALVFFGSELVLIALFAPVVSLLARAASYLPESFMKPIATRAQRTRLSSGRSRTSRLLSGSSFGR